LAAFVELTVEQGADFNTTINVKDEYGNPTNLNGYSAVAQLRKSYYSTTAIDFTVNITDEDTGETLLFANVILKGTTTGTSTNTSGFYRLVGLEAGSYVVQFTFVGYEPKEIPIRLTDGESLRLDISLKPEDFRMEEVVAVAINVAEFMRFALKIDAVERLVGGQAQIVYTTGGKTLDGHLHVGRHAWRRLMLHVGDDADVVIVTDGLAASEVDNRGRSHGKGVFSHIRAKCKETNAA
jgi:hypothetical protein